MLALSTMSACLRYADAVTRLRLHKELVSIQVAEYPKFASILDEWSASDFSDGNSDSSEAMKLNQGQENVADTALGDDNIGDMGQMEDAFDTQNKAEADAEMDIALNQYDYGEH